LRVASFAHQYLGAEDSPYHRLVSQFFFINLVRRIFEPGCQMRSVPVLEGPQNRGKSTALRLLAQPWFSDTPFRVGEKDAYQQIQGIWLYEISELESFTRAEASAVKAFISSRDDNFRAPYARQNEKHDRQTVFGATTNAQEYLKDWTGNTRFWPLLCGTIDLEAIARDRDQLIAEAVALYLRGERSHPSREEEDELFAPEQDQRLMPHPWLPLIEGWLIGKSEVTVLDILSDCIKLDMNRVSPTGAEAQRVGQVLSALGWVKRRARDARRTRVWQRVESTLSSTAKPEDDSDIPF
jgi:predicted P-loop ATPase